MNAQQKYAAKQRAIKRAAFQVARRTRLCWFRGIHKVTIDLSALALTVANTPDPITYDTIDPYPWLDALANALLLVIEEDRTRVPR